MPRSFKTSGRPTGNRLTGTQSVPFILASYTCDGSKKLQRPLPAEKNAVGLEFWRITHTSALASASHLLKFLVIS